MKTKKIVLEKDKLNKLIESKSLSLEGIHLRENSVLLSFCLETGMTTFHLNKEWNKIKEELKSQLNSAGYTCTVDSNPIRVSFKQEIAKPITKAGVVREVVKADIIAKQLERIIRRAGLIDVK